MARASRSARAFEVDAPSLKALTVSFAFARATISPSRTMRADCAAHAALPSETGAAATRDVASARISRRDAAGGAVPRAAVCGSVFVLVLCEPTHQLLIGRRQKRTTRREDCRACDQRTNHARIERPHEPSLEDFFEAEAN